MFGLVAESTKLHDGVGDPEVPCKLQIQKCTCHLLRHRARSVGRGPPTGFVSQGPLSQLAPYNAQSEFTCFVCTICTLRTLSNRGKFSACYLLTHMAQPGLAYMGQKAENIPGVLPGSHISQSCGSKRPLTFN